MNVAIVWDQAINVNSYYVKDKVGYSFKDNKPYTYHHTISKECYSNTHNWNFLWDNGYFLNLSEWETFGPNRNLPDLDLDVIFYACERSGLFDDKNKSEKFQVSVLRDKYPKAKIVGYLKEVYVSSDEKFKNRIKFLKECDFIHAEAASSMKKLPEFLKVEKLVGKKLNFSNQPLNIDYYFNNLYSNEKNNSIWAYLPLPMERRGQTYDFAKRMGEKYNMPVLFKPLSPGQSFDYLGQRDFVNMWKDSLYHFNLDPRQYHPGGQVIQVASVGSLNIGGCNESHDILYPNTSTCDEKILEEKFDEYVNSPEKVIKDIQYAWDKLNETYSFSVVRKQLEDLYG